MLANLVFARRIGIEPKKPKIKLPQLSHYFSMRIDSKKGLPKGYLRNLAGNIPKGFSFKVPKGLL